MLSLKISTLFARCALALTMLAPTLFVAPVAQAEDNTLPVWQVFCDANHFAPDDPIVYPGQPGASHMHSFYGNTSTNANTTVNTLLASRSSCGREMENTDHSAYWVPSLMNNGQRVSSGTVFVYYQKAGGQSGPAVKPIPTGLRIIAGSMASTASNPNPESQTYWSCGGGGGGPHYNHIPLCGSLGPLHAAIDFPSCWDGKHLDSADHKSHMAYANSKGVCPATHPVSLPQVHYELDYPGNKGGSSYTLASGGQYSMHGDFFGAWDVQVQNALVAECINANRDCSDITRSGNTLYVPAGDHNSIPRIDITKYSKTQNYQIENPPVASATPMPSPMDHSGHVMGGSTTPTPTPTATPTTDPGTLPETGVASVVGGALAVALIGYGFYEYRYRRRSLLQALRSVGKRSRQ